MGPEDRQQQLCAPRQGSDPGPMMKLRALLRDERGANLVEFAIALPVLVSFIWGILQVGLIFQAQAGVQHALGEAARLATIWPTPSDTTIRAKVASRKFGT